jgi:hypothetical protein
MVMQKIVITTYIGGIMIITQKEVPSIDDMLDVSEEEVEEHVQQIWGITLSKEHFLVVN